MCPLDKSLFYMSCYLYLISFSVSTVASSDPIVSTDGLGSSLDGSTSISSFEEQPYRPAFAKNLGMCNFSANKKIFNSRSYIEDLFISNTTLNKIILMKCIGK